MYKVINIKSLISSFVTSDLIFFSVETASVSDLIPLPYHSMVLTNNDDSDANIEQLTLESSTGGAETEKDYDTTIDYSLGSHPLDFVFPCQPDTVRTQNQIAYYVTSVQLYSYIVKCYTFNSIWLTKL